MAVGQLSPARSLRARLEALSVFAAVLAAIGSAWAAYETRRSAEETGRAAKATVWSDLLSEYSTDEMLQSMKMLRDFQRGSPQTFAQDFRSLLAKHDKSQFDREREAELDNARRRVRKFFDKVQVFYEGGIIEHDFITKTWGPAIPEYMTTVLCPLENAKAEALRDMGAQSAASKTETIRRTSEFEGFYRHLLGGPH